MPSVPSSDLESLKYLTRFSYKSTMKLLAYVDILGFRELIKELNEDESLTDDIVDGIGLFNDVAELIKTNPIVSVSFFSDLIVLSQPCDSLKSDPLILLSLLGSIQGVLLANGYLSRGAVVMGKAVHNPLFLFGEALIEAYDLERHTAKYPRIIITDEAEDIIKNNLLSLHSTQAQNLSDKVMKRDFDGIRYLNFLAPLPAVSGRNIYSEIRESVVRELNKTRKNVNKYTKAYWLASYFNETLREMKWPGVMEIPH